MIDITNWMSNFLQRLNKTFENRVWFVGLQGSCVIVGRSADYVLKDYANVDKCGG